MEPFLQQVAKAILKEHGDGLRDVAVVLPSRRAGLYLRKWIAQEAGQALWSPQFFTIGTFMEELSALRPLANEELLFEGYEAYRQVEGARAQALGDFMQWGGTVLADISEADAHLVPLESYYRDLRHWEEIEWTFNDSPLSEGQERMVRFWAMVGRLHAALNTRLAGMMAGTTGLIERTATARAREHQGRWRAVWFTGLNAFTPAQESVVRFLHGQGIARMAWDADHYYVDRPGQEAGQHLRKALGYFGKGVVPMGDHLAAGGCRMDAVRTPNDVVQAWCAAALLGSATEEERARTAVVLADESLLQPLLEALPGGLGPLNITMGLPAAQLPVGSFLDALHRLHAGMRPGQGFFHKDLERFLGHPFLRGKATERAMAKAVAEVHGRRRAFHGAAFLREVFGQGGLFPEAADVFTEVGDVRAAMPQVTAQALAWARRAMAGDTLATEQLFQASLVLRRVHVMLDRYRHDMDMQAYAALFRRLLAAARIGFYGEPLAGVQVMGMLEARALDPERLIVLGAQEGSLPADTSGRSYIPFELRRAHGMPLREGNDAVQAYNFLRMLQRCRQATLVWAEGDESQGPSRFILQLRHELLKEQGRDLDVRDAEVDMPPTRTAKVGLHKGPPTLRALRERLARGLPPSALGDWLRCPLDFHFKHVLRLRESAEADVRIAPDILGAALHNAVEAVYRPLLGRLLRPQDLEQGVDALPDLLRAELEKDVPADQLARGQPMLQAHMALHAAWRFLQNEVQVLRGGAHITVLGQEVALDFPLVEAAQAIGSPVVIKGRLDRVDKANGLVRILDLKTGKVKEGDLSIREWSLDALRGNKRYAAQLMVYAWLYLQGHPEVEAVQTGILPLQRAASSEPLLMRVAGEGAIARKDLPAIAAVLTRAVEEMMDPDRPVEHDPESRFCTFCLQDGSE